MAEPRPPACGRDSALLAAGAFVAYVALHQQAIHGLDAYYLIQYLSQGVAHERHVLYLRLVEPVRAALAPLGISTYRALLLCASLGTALAVLCAHRAALRLGATRAGAAAAAALVATSPAVVFFATVVEIHGVFVGFAGLAWLLHARLTAAPRVPGALLLGAATGLATAVHTTGHLLLLSVVLWFWSDVLPRRRLPRRRALLLAALAAATHVAVTLGLALALQPGALGAQGAFLGAYGREEHALAALPRTFWREWLWPFAPISVLWLASFAKRETRAAALATAIAVGAYEALAFWVLHQTDERGAYLLPLAFPAAWLTARALPRRGAWLAALAAAILAVLGVVQHERTATPKAGFAQGVAALAAHERALLICAGKPEVDAVLRAAPELPCLALYTLAGQFGDYEALCRGFDDALEVVRNQGRTPYLTAGARDALARAGDPLFGRFFAEHLTARYRLEPVRAGGFDGYRIALRTPR